MGHKVKLSGFVKIIVLAILSFHSALLLYSGKIHSPNLDEVAHITAGLSHWEFGNFSIYRVNPPLVKAVAALPVYLSEHKTDWRFSTFDPTIRVEWKLGQQFIKANGQDAFYFYFLARMACIPFSLLGAWICFRWSTELFGPGAGIMAMSLWCFSPTVLGWGASITPDVGAAAFGVACFYCFWRWLKEPTWLNTATSGVVLGLAELTKTTWIILFPCLPLVWFFWNLSDLKVIRQNFYLQLRQIILILFCGIYFINLGYGFSNTFQPLGKYQFISQSLNGIQQLNKNERVIGNRFQDSSFADIPVPLPQDYLMGIDIQKRDFEMTKWSYLFGEHKKGGWWYYYLVALILKVPVGYLILFFCALFSLKKKYVNNISVRDELYLILPAFLILFLVSSQTGFSRYLRYILPSFPFAFIWISRCFSHFKSESPCFRMLISCSFLWAMSSSLWFFPHSLSYFNEIAGGPSLGHRYLIDANIDWGQDILLLKKWQERSPDARPLYLDAYTSFDPKDAGVEYKQIPEFTSIKELQAGWYVISIHQLHDRNNKYDEFLNLNPVTRIGYSLYVYVIVPQNFQLPATPFLSSNPTWISVSRDKPPQNTMLPGGGSFPRAR